ncbi:MAG: hypothetical protein AAGI90_03460 [Chlamydiota bacterium]
MNGITLYRHEGTHYAVIDPNLHPETKSKIDEESSRQSIAKYWQLGREIKALKKNFRKAAYKKGAIIGVSTWIVTNTAVTAASVLRSEGSLSRAALCATVNKAPSIFAIKQILCLAGSFCVTGMVIANIFQKRLSSTGEPQGHIEREIIHVAHERERLRLDLVQYFGTAIPKPL